MSPDYTTVSSGNTFETAFVCISSVVTYQLRADGIWITWRLLECGIETMQSALRVKQSVKCAK